LAGFCIRKRLQKSCLSIQRMHADKVSGILRSEIAGTRLLARGMP
jgi:hypothetical protein